MIKKITINGVEHTIETAEIEDRKGWYNATYVFKMPNSEIPNFSGAFDESFNRIEDTDEERLIQRVVEELSREK